MSTKLRKELHDSPHPKKSKRISLKVKERVRKQNQTAEERQIAKSKDNEEHICTYTRTKKKKNTKRDLPPHRHLLVSLFFFHLKLVNSKS